MKTFTFTMVVLCTALFSLNLYSQTKATILPDTADYPYWVDMMQDPSVNFYDVQRAFNIYWEGREVTKGSGFKPFKRWEYMMQESRIFPDGERIPALHVRNEYFNYLESHSANRSPSGNWISLGPEVIPLNKGYKGLGRLNAIAFHPSDTDILYVGSPSGGLWKTTVGGNDWSPLIDDQPSLGVSAIIIDYNDPDLIYIGTGDRDAGDAFGFGVMKSDDGGATWMMWNNGMGEKTVGRLIQHPTNNQIILAATSGGIYKSIDAGANWYQTQTGGNYREIVFKTDDPSVVFAAAGGNFYKSTDMGETFTMITNGLPGGSRAVIGVTPAAPSYVYFLITYSDSYKGLYRSTNSGQTFTEKSTTPNIMSWGCNGGSGGQAWYDLEIAVDPFNADVVYAGGVNCFKSSNGGQTWNISSHWWGDCGVSAVHADLHVLEYNPLNWTLYAGNDGGIYYTDDQGSSWNLISNGLVISQVYKIGQSATVRDKCLNGYQDNGTSTFMGSFWEFTRGGDGMECAVDHEDAAYSYATVYFGNIDRYYNNAFNADVASNGHFGLTEDGAWITPFLIDEEDSKVMFLGYKNVWRCRNVKAPQSQIHWDKISDNLTNSNMRVLEQSPADVNIIYAARYDDRLFRSDNAHADNPGWYEISSFLPENAGVNDLECHPEDPDIVYMSHDNKIWKSTDKGLSWEDISGTLPDVAYSSIAYYENSHEGLYISSDIGVFYKDMFMPDWAMFSNGLPVDASIREIEIYYHPDSAQNDIIRAGTYGRGMWESDICRSAPVADLTASETTIPIGCEIDFTDLSSGVPSEWEWTFDGATPDFSTDKDPSNILYDNEGTFEVKLIVTNEAGMDSIIKTEYITVSTEILPEVNFVASETNTCTNGLVYFTDSTLFCPSEWAWEFSPTTIYYREGTGPESQNPVVEFRQAGSYTVTLTATNTNGSNTLIKTDYIYVGGFSLPYTEDFEDGSLAENEWTVVNPDYGNTWTRYEIEATGNYTAQMRFYGYFQMGARDQLISPYLNFSDFDDVFLNFRYAYAQRFSQKDSLIVYVSDDCGTSWGRVYTGGPDGTGVFATAEPDPYEFIPVTDELWCGLGYGAECISLDLSEWAGQSDMRIMFESYNNLGNNLYIDDIMVSNTTGVIDKPGESQHTVNIYPNPNNGSFTIIGHGFNSPVELRIVNTRGQIVHFENCRCNTGSLVKDINISTLPGGVYFVKIISDSIVQVKKIIVH